MTVCVLTNGQTPDGVTRYSTESTETMVASGAESTVHIRTDAGFVSRVLDLNSAAAPMATTPTMMPAINEVSVFIGLVL